MNQLARALSVRTPSKRPEVDLVMNRKPAKQIGLTSPPNVLARAIR